MPEKTLSLEILKKRQTEGGKRLYLIYLVVSNSRGTTYSVPIGNKIAYTKEEAIMEAQEIARATELEIRRVMD